MAKTKEKLNGEGNVMERKGLDKVKEFLYLGSVELELKNGLFKGHRKK